LSTNKRGGRVGYVFRGPRQILGKTVQEVNLKVLRSLSKEPVKIFVFLGYVDVGESMAEGVERSECKTIHNRNVVRGGILNRI
jgi:hypothetical protein